MTDTRSTAMHDEAVPSHRNAVIRKLWLRINERGDFPMLSDSLRTTISAMKGNEYDFTQLVQLVLSDFTLTQRVIRLANSAMYIAFGGNITTVSRALMVLGMEAVGHLLLGIKLVDHFQQSHSQLHRLDAKLELNRAMLAGCVARKLTTSRDVLASEEAVVCTLMQQLGRLLCIFYLDNEWVRIRELSIESGMSEHEACEQVLGATFEELAQEAASAWGLPPIIREGMGPFDPQADQEGASAVLPAAPGGSGIDVHWLRAVSTFSTRVAQSMTVAADDTPAREQRIKEDALQFSGALSLGASALQTLVGEVERENEGQRFIKEINDLHEAVASGGEGGSERGLRNGLADLRSLPSENDLAQVLTMVSEAVLAGMGFSRTLVFVRDDRTRRFQARLGIGAGVQPLLPALAFDETFSVDVFHLAITNAVGIFIEDAQNKRFSAHIPAWFSRQVPDACAFVLLPVRANGGAQALIYGDWNQREKVRKIGPQELALLNEMARELERFFTCAK